MDTHTTERVETLVIGGGQAGLSVGHHLARHDLPHLIVDGSDRVGDAWRRRWDSLRLFSPAMYDGLDGMPYPAAPNDYPTKDEFADYLEHYASTFELPVRTGTRVRRLGRDGDRYVAETDDSRILAEQVVVAMGGYQRPRTPGFAEDLDPGIVQVHAGHYHRPSQLQPGATLVVGAGNSGAEIAMDLLRADPGREVVVAGRNVGAIPFRITGLFGRAVGVRLVVGGLFHHVLTINTPPGRKARDKVLTGSGPLIRTKRPDLAAAGVRFAGHVDGVQDGLPVLDDGRTLEVANVVWCTGFDAGFDWIDLPVHAPTRGRDPRGRPGAVPARACTSWACRSCTRCRPG